MQPTSIDSVCGETGLLSVWIPAPPPSRWRRSRPYRAGALVLCALIANTFPALAHQGGPSRASADPLQRAALLVQQGRLDEAEAQARRALADPATQAVAYSVLGTISFQRNQLEDSVASFKKAVALNAWGQQLRLPAPWWFWNLFGEQAVFLLSRHPSSNGATRI